MYKQIEKEILNLSNPEKAKILQRFFKTGKWEYGEWDIFLGITIPEQRQIVKKYFKEVGFEDVQRLLESKYHEFRMVWLLFLVAKYNASGGILLSTSDKSIQKRLELAANISKVKSADELII